MHPRRSCEENRCFHLSVGSSSGGLDKLMSSPITINLDRYKTVDGWSRLGSI